MRTLTFFRGMAWFGVAVVFWSLNVRWGADLNLPKGPGPWQRAVVGCGLLAFIAAASLSISGRGGAPPSWLARAIAGACSLAMLFITWSLYNKGTGLRGDLIQGIGWKWLAAGSGMVMSAVIGTLGIKPAKPEKPAGDKKGQDSRNRRKR